MPTTFNWIYLGTTTTVLDPTEGNAIVENSALLNGTTWGSTGNPLFTHVISTTMIDNGGAAGSLDNNNTASNDQFSTNIGTGTQTYTYDGAVNYNITVTYADGTTGVVTGVIAQSTTGELFLAPETAANADTTTFEAKPIRSITITSVSANNGNFTTNRVLTGWDDGYVEGTAGADLINGTYVEPIANGSDKVDNNDAGLTGTTGNDDYIRAGAGNDTVFANLGNDVVDAGTGADSVDGGIGNDSILGGTGIFNDTLIGGDGNDTLRGDDGIDSLFGGAGVDSIDGGIGADIIDGGTEADSVDGGTGNDSILGGTGVFNDTLIGGDGNDTLRGDDGNDSLFGGAGVDSIDGGIGADIIDAGTEADSVDGGTGNDSILGGTGVFSDTLTGGDGNDTLRGDDGNDSLFGGAGVDSIDGGIGADVIDAGTEADSVDGGAGNDSILGGTGVFNDTLLGGDGDDTLRGDDGNDSLFGGAGVDSIDGGIGADIIDGGDGADNITGSAGNDTLTGGVGADTLTGGDDRDTFFGGAGDIVDGSETGDDVDTLDLRAYGKTLTNIIYGGGNNEAGTVEFLDGLGVVTGSMAFSNIETVIPCFTPGSQVVTERGDIAVERLVVGDNVLTRDHGYQTIRWIGQRRVTAWELALQPQLNPIMIPAGALGQGMPSRDLVVSPQHRMLFSDPHADLFFGEQEVLIAAIHLVGHAGIKQLRPESVVYLHVMFDNHEVICADGAWSESFQPGLRTMAGMDRQQHDEIITLFPNLGTPKGRYPAARLTLKRHEARVLLASQSVAQSLAA